VAVGYIPCKWADIMLRSALDYDHDLETRRYDYCDVASTELLSYRATLFLTHFTSPYLLP